jgi:hypothetical protein
MPHGMTRAAILLFLLLLPAHLTGCGRRPQLPDVAGPLAWVVVEASFAGEPLPALVPDRLLLDSIAFPRLGEAAGTGRLDAAELRRQVGRSIELVDPLDVLSCPPRQPCRVAGDATFLTVWDAERTRDGIELVVNRVHNVQGLYRKTTAVTHRIEVRPQGSGWRLTRRERLPT